MTSFFRVAPALALLLVLIPLGASAQGRIMTEQELSDAARRGLDLVSALEDRFLGLRTEGGPRSGWCLEYRQVRDDGRCRSLAVYVDGVRIVRPGYYLASQPLDDVERAELLSAVDATTRYGGAGAYGALVIETRMGLLP